LLKSVKNLFGKDALIVFIVIMMHLGIGLGIILIQWHNTGRLAPQIVTLNLYEGMHQQSPLKPSNYKAVKSISNADTVDPRTLTTDGFEPENFNHIKVDSKNFRNRNILSNPKPPYPLVSRRMREQGTAHLRLCINETGLIDNITLAKSSGYELLDQSAINTVKAWRFSKVDLTYPSIECYRLPVNFTLEG